MEINHALKHNSTCVLTKNILRHRLSHIQVKKAIFKSNPPKKAIFVDSDHPTIYAIRKVLNKEIYVMKNVASFLMAGNVRRINSWHISWNLKLLLNLHQTILNFDEIFDTKNQCEEHEQIGY